MVDLTKYSLHELHELQNEIDKAVEQRRKDNAKKAQEELKQVAASYGFSLNELVDGQGGRSKSGSGRTSKLPPKFQHRDDASKSWTGRGRKPKWVTEWEQAGNSLEQLRIG